MSEAWPVMGQNAARTGYDAALTRPRWPVEERWRHDFAGRVAWNAPVVDERGDSFVHVKMTQADAPGLRASPP